ncbi:hypothetical protein QL285_059551 [Trifolium repens]|nr:hypothetical protein QL285_059551 [Trifolium repens]
MWLEVVPSSTAMQRILFWQVEVSTTGIQLHQQMRCSSSYCHESSRHGVGACSLIPHNHIDLTILPVPMNGF